MTDVQDGAIAPRGAATTRKVTSAPMTAMQRQLEQVIQRQRASDERDRIAEREALAKRLSGPRPARSLEKGPEPFQPSEELRGPRSRFARSRRRPPKLPDGAGGAAQA